MISSVKSAPVISAAKNIDLDGLTSSKLAATMTAISSIQMAWFYSIKSINLANCSPLVNIF